MRTPHSITVQDDGPVTQLRLRGEIDVALRDQAGRALATALTRGAPVRVDLGEVTFIDSAGVAFLVQCHRACTQAELDCVLVDVPDQAMKVLEMLGLTSVLTIERSAESVRG